MHLVNFSTFDQSAQKLNHKLNVIWFSPQIGDLLGTSLLAMAFLALEEMGIYTHIEHDFFVDFVTKIT